MEALIFNSLPLAFQEFVWSAIIIMKPIILSNLFVVALLICLTVKYGSSLKCYECDSYRLSPDDATACIKLDPSMIKECPVSSKVVCRTLKAENSFTGIPYIKRSCGILSVENIEEYVDRNNILMQFHKDVPVSSMVCNSNLCNGAVAFGNTFTEIIFVISVMLSVSFYMYIY